MSWWEADIADFEWVNAVTSLTYAGFGIATGDPVFAAAMCLLAAGSALFHAFPTKFTNAVDHSGMYAAMAYLVWNVGKRRWDDDDDVTSCHGAWHVLTAYRM